MKLAYLMAIPALLACGCGDGGIAGSSPTSPSQAAGGATQAACALPDPPKDLSAASSQSAVSLTWSASRYAVDYVVIVGTAPGTSNVRLTSATQPDYQLNGLAAGAYYASVRSHNWCGTSEPSSEVVFSVAE